MPRWTVLLLIPAVFLALRLGIRAVPEDRLPLGAVLPDDRPRIANPMGLTIPDGPWTLLIGGSSTYLGVDVTALPGKVLKQSLPGITASDVAAAMRWDLQVAAQHRLPDRILIGIHRASLMDRRALSGDPCLTPVFIERADADLEEAIGCKPRRGPDRLTFRAWHLDPWARRRSLLLQSLGGIGQRWLGMTQDPPTEYDVAGFAKDVSPEERFILNIRRWEAMGTYADPIDPLQERSLAYIDELAHQYGVPVVTVAFPEHSLGRVLYAPGVYERFLDQLPGEALDLGAAVPDSGFFDQAHPNHAGRAATTAALAAFLSASPRPSAPPGAASGR